MHNGSNPFIGTICRCGEMADAMDLKSIGRNTVPVQVRLPVPKGTISTGVLNILKSADVRRQERFTYRPL